MLSQNKQAGVLDGVWKYLLAPFIIKEKNKKTSWFNKRSLVPRVRGLHVNYNPGSDMDLLYDFKAHMSSPDTQVSTYFLLCNTRQVITILYHGFSAYYIRMTYSCSITVKIK